MAGLETLRTAKAALDEGLITEEDFNSVKEGFLNAQRIKAGLDAGFIPEEDFAQATAAFFESLGVSGTQAGSATPQHAAKAPQATTPQRKVQNGSSPFGRVATSATTPSQSAPSPRPKPAVGGGAPVSKKAGSPAIAMQTRANSLTNPKPVERTSAVSMSGIAVDKNAIAEFNLMRGKSKYLWMMFKIDDSGQTVIFCDAGDSSSNYNDFVNHFPENECRYGVYDFPYETSEGRKLQKLVFVNWAPDNAPVKAKMMASSTKDFFKTQIEGVQVEIQATDNDDLEDEEVHRAVGGTLTRG